MAKRQTSEQLLKQPDAPKVPECKNAWLVLGYTYRTARTFLTTFDNVRSRRGAPTQEQLYLVRAMLAFASAGLDSMVKHLIQDALPQVIRQDSKARESLREFVERKIKDDDQPDYRFLSDALLVESPADRMIELFVQDLTASSLQSVEQLLSVASHFNIGRSAIAPDPDKLRRVFAVRNQIIHEMDINFAHPHRNRRPRKREDLLDATNQLLEVSGAFLAAVDAKLANA